MNLKLLLLCSIHATYRRMQMTEIPKSHKKTSMTLCRKWKHYVPGVESHAGEEGEDALGLRVSAVGRRHDDGDENDGQVGKVHGRQPRH